MAYTYGSTKGISRKYEVYIAAGDESLDPSGWNKAAYETFRDTTATHIGDCRKSSVKTKIESTEKEELNSGAVIYGVKTGHFEAIVSEVTPDNLLALNTFDNTPVDILLEDVDNQEFIVIKYMILEVGEEFESNGKVNIPLKGDKEVILKSDFRYYGAIPAA